VAKPPEAPPDENKGKTEGIKTVHHEFGYPFPSEADNALIFCLLAGDGSYRKLKAARENGIDRMNLKHLVMDLMSPAVTDASCLHGTYSCDPKRTPKFAFGPSDNPEMTLFGMDLVVYIRELLRIPESKTPESEEEAESAQEQIPAERTEVQTEPPVQEVNPRARIIECPDKGDIPISVEMCGKCSIRDGCPAWEE
jgi:hypothetical protein